jgi:CRISPR-associated endonuclease/helicase Cas3
MLATAAGTDSAVIVPWICYIAALHDIGKADSRFTFAGPQELAMRAQAAGLPRVPSEKGFWHSGRSAQWVRHHLAFREGWPAYEANTVAAVIRGHHGYFLTEDPKEEPPEVAEVWDSIRNELERILRHIFDPAAWKPRFDDHSSVGLILSGIITLSDWIASNSDVFSAPDSCLDLQSYVTASRDAARIAVGRLGLRSEMRPSTVTSFRQMWPDFDALRPIQAEVELLVARGVEPGLAIIEAPMGEGKTEAALYLAAQWAQMSNTEGLYFALPTTATSNQMHGRVQEVLARLGLVTEQGVRLVHGMSWLVDDDTPTASVQTEDEKRTKPNHAVEWFRPAKRGLLATYGVGTIDQALSSVLYVRHSYLKLLGLSGKVLIVDEVHSYDPYMNEILVRLLEWCGTLRVPVILLSATLPASRRQLLVRAYSGTPLVNTGNRDGECPYPLITLARRGHGAPELVVPQTSASRPDVELRMHQGLLENAGPTADLVVDAASNGGCICVIANTVGSAQKLYRELLNRVDRNECELVLFHARFPAWQRAEIEKRVLDLFDKRSTLRPGDKERTIRPNRAILVATQVIEQSLDVDFDEMFTEIAPIDLMLQRIGRMHRHMRPLRPTGPIPRLHVLLPDSPGNGFGSTGVVYHPFILLKTLGVLSKMDRISLPADIRRLVELVYDNTPCLEAPLDGVTDDLLRRLFDELSKETRRFECGAHKFLSPKPNDEEFDLARVASGHVDNDEEGARTYFSARTRTGDRTRSVVIADDCKYRDVLASSIMPSRQVLRALLLDSVNVPTWWLSGVTPAEGFEPISDGPGWLGGHGIIPMRNSRWEGVNTSGNQVCIRFDPDLGLLRE